MSDTAERPADAIRTAVDGLADCDLLDAFDASDERDDEGAPGGPDLAPSAPARFLTDLADVLRRAGLRVKEVDGWQQRARGSGGFRPGRPVGIIVHHTASGPHHDGQSDVSFLTFTCAVKPMANLYLDRSGQWWVLAAGATNTNGKGGPLGPLPQDEANTRVIGIEAANDGIGEPWPPVMQDAYVVGVAALADAYDIKTEHVFAHFEWAPGRKVDPAGPSRFGAVGSWNMNAFREAVDRARRGLPPTLDVAVARNVVVTSGATYIVRPGDGWWNIAEKTMGNPAVSWLKLAEANGGRQRVLRPGDVLTIPASPDAPPPPPAGVPPFPGVAKLHDRGPVVLAWQLALIARGVIRDTQANRDQHYGPGLRDAVLALQRSWGWSDADGEAGQHTWSRLHGGP